MILVDATIKWAGYDPRELSRCAKHRVCVVCDVCGRVRWTRFDGCSDLCHLCAVRTDDHRKKLSVALTGKKFTEERCRELSKQRKGRPRKPHSEETRLKISVSNKGQIVSQEQRDQISKTLTGRKKPYIDRCRQSAAMQGVSLDDWEGFAHEQKYCPAFNEAIKERVREKYGRLCFVCGKTEEENRATHKEKLSVHHTDMNKQQGCDDHEWKLVPLCKVCHSSAHYEPMKARVEYIRYREETTVILQ